MKKTGICFVISPILVLVLRLIASFIFLPLSRSGFDQSFLLAIKSTVNLLLSILALISVPLLILGIILLVKSKNIKLHTSEAIKYSRESSKKYMTRYLLGFFLIIFLQLISPDNSISSNNNLSMNLIGFLIIIMNWRLILGLNKISLGIVYGQEYKMSDLFQSANKSFKYIIAQILNTFIVVIGFILLIVPGVIRSIKLSMVPYIILQEGIGPIQAIKKSWRITKGFVGDIFLINIFAGLINILGFLALLVGLLWTIPLYMIANAYIYKKIINYNPEKPVPHLEIKSISKKRISVPKISKKSSLSKPSSKKISKKLVKPSSKRISKI